MVSGFNGKGVMAQEGKGSLTEQVSLFEKVPEEKKLGWGGIASILSGVVSSLTKLMGGGIVAFYAGCYAGLGAAAIMFVLSVGNVNVAITPIIASVINTSAKVNPFFIKKSSS